MKKRIFILILIVGVMICLSLKEACAFDWEGAGNGGMPVPSGTMRIYLVPDQGYNVQPADADINQDGIVDEKDSDLIKRYFGEDIDQISGYDLDGDSKIGEGDIDLLKQHFGEEVNEQNAKYDLNKDGKINVKDLGMIGKYFGTDINLLKRCDVNRDGKINVKDVGWVGKYFGTQIIPIVPPNPGDGEVHFAPVPGYELPPEPEPNPGNGELHSAPAPDYQPPEPGPEPRDPSDEDLHFAPKPPEITPISDGVQVPNDENK